MPAHCLSTSLRRGHVLSGLESAHCDMCSDLESIAAPAPCLRNFLHSELAATDDSYCFLLCVWDTEVVGSPGRLGGLHGF